MDSSNNDQLQSLFEEALSLPLESRDAFLRERCGGDAELLQRLRRMLEPDRTGELSALVDLARQSTELLEERPESASREGETVGPYRLVRLIGSGTFGDVFLAEQTEPVARQVAIKVLHAGMNSAGVLRRFRAEQQSLARMDHPNIAKVYDAGVTERGLPYFVMQYVSGESITEYCDRRRLSIEERLRLFKRVCEAIEHAHIKSVVHRDLKPSNVLVTSTDGGGPEPMVIDFGVAKVIAEGEQREATHRTEAGLAVGTWAYMSPEQAAGDPDVDTRSDVYSLGVLLYELLCGAKPFEGETLRNAAEAELRRMIREDEPPSPSDRLRSDGTAETSAAARKAGVSDLTRRLRSELEWIPLFAMRKERERRYQRAAELGDDVGNYLAGRALRAAPESRAYRVRKFVRRNRAAVIGIGATIASLSIGIVGFAMQTSVISRERNRANERADAAKKAEDAERQRAEQLERVSRFQAGILSRFSTSDAGIWLEHALRTRLEQQLPTSMPKAQRADRIGALIEALGGVDLAGVAAELVDRTMLQPAVATLDSDFGDTPDVDATLRRTLGDTASILGHYAQAIELNQRAADYALATYGDADPRTAEATISLSNALVGFGQFERAVKAIRRCETGRVAAVGETDATVAALRMKLGEVRVERGEFPEACRLLASARDISSSLHGPTDERTLDARLRLADVRARQGAWPEAEREIRAVLDDSRRSLGPDAELPRRAALALGTVLQNQDRPKDAEPYFKEHLEWCVRHRGEDHPQTIATRIRLGEVARITGKVEAAGTLAEWSVSSSAMSLGPKHPQTLRARRAWAIVQMQTGKEVEGIDGLNATLLDQTEVLGPHHPDTLETAQELCYALVMSARFNEATDLIERTGESLRAQFPPSHPLCIANRAMLGMVLAYQGENGYGMSILTTAADAFVEETLTGRRWKAISLDVLAWILQDEGLLERAAATYERAADLYREPSFRAPQRSIASDLSAGAAWYKAGRMVEAERASRRAADLARIAPSIDTDTRLRTLRVLCLTLYELQKFDKALPYVREMVELRRGSTPRNDTEFAKELGMLIAVLRQRERFEDVVAACSELRSLPTAAPPTSSDGLALRFILAESKFRLGRNEGLREELAEIVRGYERLPAGAQGYLPKVRELLRLIEKRTPASSPTR